MHLSEILNTKARLTPCPQWTAIQHVHTIKLRIGMKFATFNLFMCLSFTKTSETDLLCNQIDQNGLGQAF